MSDNVEWYESEPVNKIYDFVYDTSHLNICLIDDAMMGCMDLDDFKYSLDRDIDRTINELERLRELVKALE